MDPYASIDLGALPSSFEAEVDDLNIAIRAVDLGLAAQGHAVDFGSSMNQVDEVNEYSDDFEEFAEEVVDSLPLDTVDVAPAESQGLGTVSSPPIQPTISAPSIDIPLQSQPLSNLPEPHSPKPASSSPRGIERPPSLPMIEPRQADPQTTFPLSHSFIQAPLPRYPPTSRSFAVSTACAVIDECLRSQIAMLHSQATKHTEFIAQTMAAFEAERIAIKEARKKRENGFLSRARKNHVDSLVVDGRSASPERLVGYRELFKSVDG